MDNLLLIILIISVFFQFSAAFYALHLIRITRSRSSWLLISTALFIMGFRRLLPLIDIMKSDQLSSQIILEILGLIISLFMFFGMIGIKYIFLEKIRSENHIKDLLREKQIILREVHHRIKNNMHTLSCMLKLHSKRLKDHQITAIIQDIDSRIQTMMTLYNKLYRSDNFQDISIKNYISNLIPEIINIFPVEYKLNIKQEIQDFKIGKETLFPLGIIINELITNSIKYAFTGRNEGNITVKIEKKDAQVILLVQDDGIGMKNEDKDKKGFGLMLIEELSKQIKGKYEMVDDNGITSIISFGI